MPDEPVLLTARTPWGVRLTLNRPAKLNALNGELVSALVAALDEAEADDGVRVIVLEGAGRAFSSGYDLTEEAEGTIGGPVGLAGAAGGRCRGHAPVPRLAQARDRASPRLCAGRRPRARDGLRPHRRGRGHEAR